MCECDAWNNIFTICQERGFSVLLIPISSVGERFCTYDEKKKDFDILPNGRVSPQNMELPIALAFREVVSEKRAKVQDDTHNTRWASREVKPGEWTLEGLGSLAEKFYQYLPPPRMD